MRILVTAFEPFGGDAENASLEAVKLLAEQWSDPDIDIVAFVLPVSFDRVGWMLEQAVASTRPDAVIAVGEAGGRTAVTPERFGVNEDDARIPDNDGVQPRAVRIDDGPDRRGSSFDVDAIVAAINAAGVPAVVSEDAGRFLCNHVAYLVSGLDVPGGFVHVPAVRSSGVATVGGETDGFGRDAREAPEGPVVADLATALAATVRVVAS